MYTMYLNHIHPLHHPSYLCIALSSICLQCSLMSFLPGTSEFNECYSYAQVCVLGDSLQVSGTSFKDNTLKKSGSVSHSNHQQSMILQEEVRPQGPYPCCNFKIGLLFCSHQRLCDFICASLEDKTFSIPLHPSALFLLFCAIPLQPQKNMKKGQNQFIVFSVPSHCLFTAL